MNEDSIDGPGKPFEPETPEEFLQRGEEAFQIWWDELDSPGSSGGLELDCEIARAVWVAAYEHSADCIMLVYDGARANVEGAHPTGEMYLASPSIAITTGAFLFSAATFSTGLRSTKTIFGTSIRKINSMPMRAW